MTSVHEQLPMEFNRSGPTAPRAQTRIFPHKRWLGLATHNRRLFEALQDGWLRPVSTSAGQLL